MTVAAVWLFVASCSSVPSGSKDAGGEIRFHNWWNFYERGAVRVKDGNWAGAQEDLERCLGRKSGAKFGNPKDALRVRTYGVHMLESYFPNRELGICLFMQGRAADAIPLLEKSLKQEPTSRAKYYLNCARRSLLAAGGATKPEILLAAECRAGWTREHEVVVAGRVRAKGLVAEVEIAGERDFIELAEDERAFLKTVPLSQGTNRVTITACDLLNQAGEKTVELIADWRRPTLTISTVKQDANGWQIAGFIVDDQSLRRATIDGRELKLDAQARKIDASWTVANGMSSVVVAEDLAGNVMTAKVSSAELSVAWAEQSGWQFADAGATTLPKKSSGDAKPPSMSLSASTEERIIVNHARFYLDGSARDMGGLREISVMGEPYLRDGETGCVEKHFSAIFDLAPGTNSFCIVATDMAGNCSSQQVVIVRIVDEFLSSEYRLTVAVPPLLNPDRDSLVTKAHREINGHVMKEPKRFRLLERNEGWDAVLQEHQLSASGLVRQDMQLQVGKMLPAELLLLGELLHEGKGVTLRVNVVESSKGETLFTEDVYTEQPDSEVREKSAGLVMKIKQRMPMVKGRIVRVDGDRIVIDLGAENGLMTASQFVVARLSSDGAQGSGSAVLCRVGEQWIRLRVEEVQSRQAVTMAQPEKAGKLLKPGDIVFAR